MSSGTLYLNDSVGVHLREKAGYNVGMFGKANFNTCQGFDRWFQGAFLGYGGNWHVTFVDATPRCPTHL